MLRTSQKYTHISDYHVLESAHNLNKTPSAQPGTQATIFNSHRILSSWGNQAVDSFYVTPAKKHYRCWDFYVPETKGFLTSVQATFYPTHWNTPTETLIYAAVKNAHDSTNEIRRANKDIKQFPKQHMETLKQFGEIFQIGIDKTDTDTTMQQQTPTNTTATHQLQLNHLRNHRVTINNTPGLITQEAPQIRLEQKQKSKRTYVLPV